MCVAIQEKESEVRKKASNKDKQVERVSDGVAESRNYEQVV